MTGSVVRVRARRAVFGVLVLTAFVTSADSTIVAAAAPSIRRDLAMSVGAVQWASVAYLLPFAGLLLVAGRVIDRFGVRNTLRGGLIVAAVGAVVGGLARAPEPLVAGRAVQGAASAFLVPGALSLIRSRLPAGDRTFGAALWTATIAVALGLGPWLGGVLAERLHWSLIFLATIPVLVLMWPLLSAAAPSGGTFRGRAKLVPNRTFVVANLVGLLWGAGIGGVLFYTPMLHQDFLGMSPQEAGLPLVVVAVAVVCATPFVPAVERALGAGRAACFGLVVVAAGLFSLAVVNSDPDLAPRLVSLVVVGLGAPFTAPVTTHALDALPQNVAGAASSVTIASREAGTALGVVSCALVLAAHTPALPGGFTVALVVAGTVELCGAAVAGLLLRR